MKDLEIIVERALPTAALVAKYPALKNLASTGLAMIEDAFADLPTETGQTEVGWVEHFASHFSEAALRGAVDFYNTVVQDGRFISNLASDPRTAATQLGLTVSDDVFAVLAAATDQTTKLPNIALLMRQKAGITPFVGPAAVIAIIVVVVVAGGALGWHLAQVTRSDAKGDDAAGVEPVKVVIDYSGQIKL